jgi:hypothetical protein
MRLAPPFHRFGDHIGVGLPGGQALFTTRRGGISRGPYASLNLGLARGSPGGAPGDEPAAVRTNRARVAGAIGLPVGALAQGRQVHAAHVRRVTAPDQTAEREPADGQATALQDVAPIVLTADCLPVALIATEAVAMVHAGWRGLADGVLAEGVRALRELGAEGEIAAAIGPGAGACCYEVGDEVHAALAHAGPAARRGRCADLKAVARLQLEAAGVEEIHDVGICTICSDPALFFSHRRDAGLTGRQAGIAWRVPESRGRTGRTGGVWS